MKPIESTLAVLVLALGYGASSHAETHAAPAQDAPMNMQGGMGMHKGMGMNGSMSDAEIDQHLRMHQEHLLKMHDLSNRILSETDEKKKEQLKSEQRQLMKAQFEQMRAHRMEKMQHRQKPAEKSGTQPHP